jgi:hypothetical protein
VIGAGPAGLAAAARLLEEGRGRVQVRLVHMGHHLGGKAASYRDPEGRLVEHGWHMVLGFYQNLRGLMARAGVDPAQVLASMRGQSHVYESWDRALHTLDSSGGRVEFASRFVGYEGLPFFDRLGLGRFMAGAFGTALSGEDLTRHDDLCFRTFAVEHGLRPHITRYSLFRMFREAFFNFPEEISAYHVLKTMQLMSDSEQAEIFVLRGGYSELIWDPIGRYVERLGGLIEPFTLATDWIYDGRRITGVRVGRPDSRGHHEGSSSWSTAAIPIATGTERVIDDFDFVISTIPNAVLVRMNAADARMWGSPFFARLSNLRSAATISMTVRTRRPMLEACPGPVHGLPAPLGIVTNMKRYWTEAAEDRSIGAVLVFVGQEAGFEGWSDADLIERTLDNVAAVRELGDVRKSEIVDVELHRNRSDFERILLCEPGVQQFRPGPITPFHNLFLAGDWVRNAVDVISMEGAVTSGIESADQVLARIGAGG